MMGYYIQTPGSRNKVAYLKQMYGAVEIEQISTLNEIPDEGMGLVCVVDNGSFEAAGYIYDDNELKRALPVKTDQRKRTWLIFNKKKIENLSGFYQHRSDEV